MCLKVLSNLRVSRIISKSQDVGPFSENITVSNFSIRIKVYATKVFTKKCHCLKYAPMDICERSRSCVRACHAQDTQIKQTKHGLSEGSELWERFWRSNYKRAKRNRHDQARAMQIKFFKILVCSTVFNISY